MSETLQIDQTTADVLSSKHTARRLITVESCKFDKRIKRAWSAHLVAQNDPLIILDGVFENEIRHALLGTIARGTRSIEFYWMNRWYSVFRFHEPNGRLRNFYCNINMPPEFDGARLRFIDLDIDMLVQPDMSLRVLDVEEFNLNAVCFNYTDEIRAQVAAAIDELKELITTKQFPFDNFMLSESV